MTETRTERGGNEGGELYGRCAVCGRRVGRRPGDAQIFKERTPWGTVKYRYICRRCNSTGAIRGDYPF